MFSGTGNPMILLLKLSDVTGSWKSKMAAAKPEPPHISACRQDSNEILTAIVLNSYAKFCCKTTKYTVKLNWITDELMFSYIV